MLPLFLSLALLPQDATPETELLPRRVLFGAPQIEDVRLSVDGAHLGWLAPDEEGVLQLHLGAVEDPSAATMVTSGDEPVREWRWAFSDEHVLFTRGVEGGATHLFVLSKLGGSTFDVTPDASGEMYLVGHGRQWPTHVALEYRPEGEEHGVWLLEFIVKERHRMCAGGFERYVFDGNMWPVGASGAGEDGLRIARMLPSGSWQEVVTCGFADGKASGVVSADFGGDLLFYVAAHDRDRTQLRALDINDDTTTVLFEHERCDVLPFAAQIDARTRMPIAVRTSFGVLEQHFIDRVTLQAIWGGEEPVTPAIEEDWEIIGLTIPGEVRFVDQDRLGVHWLLEASGDGPPTYWLFDRETLEVTRLLSSVVGLPEDVAWAAENGLVLGAADGRKLPCRWFAPPGTDGPIATVVLVHGGPWNLTAAEGWATRSHIELLVQRGYGVLAPEFRGAAGFGRTWLDAGDSEFGNGMIDDVLDATRAAIELGLVKQDAIAIHGWSYGGYAVLRAMTREPDLFQCGLAGAAIGDLVALQQGKQAQPAWRALWNVRVGDPTKENGLARLKAQSPIHQVADLEAPLLMAHGALDLTIPKEQSDAFAMAALATGKPLTYLVFSKEPHNLRQPASWAAWWAAAEHLLAAELGGRAEPYGVDLRAAEVVVAAGADHVPGLADAAK